MSIRTKASSLRPASNPSISSRKGMVTLAEAAQAVLDRWTRGDLAEAVRELDSALRQYRMGLGSDPQELDQIRGRNDRG